MEANIVVKAEDLTNDFADGLRKIFSPNALLHIKVEYDLSELSGSARQPNTSSSATPAAVTGKKRGRKPKPKPEAQAPKKRGRKPKVAAE